MIARIFSKNGLVVGEIELLPRGDLHFRLPPSDEARIRSLFDAGIKTYHQEDESVDRRARHWRALPRSQNWFRAVLDDDLTKLGFSYEVGSAPGADGAKAVLVATPGADLRDVAAVLSERSISWKLVPSPVGDPAALRRFRQAVKNSDFVLAYIGTSTLVAAVTFQVGVAVGEARDVIVFTDAEAGVSELLPNLPVTNIVVADSTSMAFQLDLFLKAVKPRPRGRGPRPARERSAEVKPREWVREALKPLQTVPEERRGAALEHVVEHLFKTSGAVIYRDDSSESEARVDLAVWVDELPEPIGNPILVEVKGGNLTLPQLQRAADELGAHLRERGLTLGLLIYGDVEGRTFLPSEVGSPLVLWYSVQELAEIVRTNSLPQVIWRARNQAIHGIA